MNHCFVDSSAAQRIIFGAGESSRLGSLLAELGSERPFLVTSHSYRRNGALDGMRSVLADRIPVVFDDARPHVPLTSVNAAAQIAQVGRADAVVALGGGSALGTGKAVVAALKERSERGYIPLVALPTTYAGSEMTAVYGTTSEGQKTTRSNPHCLARLVIYDPDLTLDLPAELTAGTAVNALAHCVEATYSRLRTPLGTAAALGAAPVIVQTLPVLMTAPEDQEARARMLTAAHLAGVSLAHSGMALHHAICHALGGVGVSHGSANRIMLPHVMRFNLGDAATELATVARALSSEADTVPGRTAAEAAIERTEELLMQLPLPGRLREVGIHTRDFPSIASTAFSSSATRSNPRIVRSAGEIEDILGAAW